MFGVFLCRPLQNNNVNDQTLRRVCLKNMNYTTNNLIFRGLLMGEQNPQAKNIY